MKKSVLFICLLITLVCVQAQKKTNTPVPTSEITVVAKPDPGKEIALQKSIYKRAMRYGDADMAKNALFYLIEIDSTGGAYKDSLLALYFSSRAYVNAVLLGRELYKENAKSQNTVAILAASEQTLGLITESLDHYKALFALSNSPADLYQVAMLEYRLERMGECKVSLERIIAHPNAEKENVYIAYNEKEGQNVAVKAAALNIKGYILLQADQKDAAREAFNQALRLSPEFQLPKNNLYQMDNPGQALPKAPGDPNRK